MSYPIARIDPTTAGRERSPSLWRNELEKYSADKSLGVLRADDFTEPQSVSGAGALSTNGRWWMAEAGTTGATSETANTTTDPNGVLHLLGTTGTDFIGVEVQAGSSATLIENIVLPTATTNAKGTVVFEARVYLDTAANDTFFVGLAEAGSTVLTGDNTLTLAADYIGFYRLDAANLLFISRNDNNTGTAVSSSQIIKTTAQVAAGYEDAYVKLGFRVNYDNTVEVFVDSVRIRKDSSDAVVTVASTALPIEKLTRKVSVCRGATLNNATVSVDIDWIDCWVAE